jgi:hypothetical protein
MAPRSPWYRWLAPWLLLAACARAPAENRRPHDAAADAAVDDQSDAPIASGDGSIAPDVPTAAGKRLRARHAYFGAHQLHVVGTWDTKLDAWCEFADSGDGKWRCLPGSFYPKDLLYLDAACTQPVATNPPGPIDGLYAVDRQLSPCGGAAYDLYRRLDSVETLPTFAREGGTCKPNPAGVVSVHRLEKITADTVVGTRVLGEARNGIAPVFIHAEGAVLRQDEWYDTNLDVPCRTVIYGPGDFWAAPDKMLRCLPLDTQLGGAGGYFSDQACQRPATPTFSRCTPGHVGERHEDGRCPMVRRYYRLGPLVPTLFLSQGAGQTCQPAPGNDLDGREVLEEIPPDALPAAELVLAPGTERIREMLVKTAAGTGPGYHLQDETLQASCWRAETIDGRLHCVPHGLSFRDEHRFADAACTRSLATTSAQRCLPSTFAYQMEGTESYRVARVFRDPVLHQGPVYTNSAGTCLAAATHPLGYPDYDLGVEIPFAELAELRVEEP